MAFINRSWPASPRYVTALWASSTTIVGQQYNTVSLEVIECAYRLGHHSSETTAVATSSWVIVCSDPSGSTRELCDRRFPQYRLDAVPFGTRVR